MPKNPDKKTLWNGNIYENYFLKFSKSICQYVEVTCICTPTANTTGKHAVTHRGTVHNSFAGCGTYSPLPDPWHGSQAVDWTGKISHLLQANIFQAIFMRNLEGRLWHIWSDQEKMWWYSCAGCFDTAPVYQTVLWGSQHRGWFARCRTEPDVVGNKRCFTAIHPSQPWNLDYVSSKILAKLTPEKRNVPLIS